MKQVTKRNWVAEKTYASFLDSQYTLGNTAGMMWGTSSLALHAIHLLFLFLHKLILEPLTQEMGYFSSATYFHFASELAALMSNS